MNKVFFTADLHFGAVDTLKYLPERPFAQEESCMLHDSWLMDLWRGTVREDDQVYILGDMCAYNARDARNLLGGLPGRKTLIVGNHDSGLRYCRDCLDASATILNVSFKKEDHRFLHHTIHVTMCHYPMLTWQRKPYGAIMLHGHSHGMLDDVNRTCPDLRWDVGIDGSLSRLIGSARGMKHSLIDLESLYNAAIEKAGSPQFRKYVRDTYRNGQPELESALKCAYNLGH